MLFSFAFLHWPATRPSLCVMCLPIAARGYQHRPATRPKLHNTLERDLTNSSKFVKSGVQSGLLRSRPNLRKEHIFQIRRNGRKTRIRLCIT
jgi:hypothetical protein